MSTTQEALTSLYDRWMKAIQRDDFETLDAIIADDFTYAATNHGRQTRQQWWDTVPAYTIKAFELNSIDVREYGDTAVVVCEYAQDAIVRGTPRSGEFLITDTWIKRDGRWQVVARSSILMEPPPG